MNGPFSDVFRVDLVLNRFCTGMFSNRFPAGFEQNNRDFPKAISHSFPAVSQLISEIFSLFSADFQISSGNVG